MTDPVPSPSDIGSVLGDVFAGRTLSRERARAVMGQLMDGNLSQMQAAALLAALRTRGETVDEITGFAEAMRERAIKVPVRVDGPLLDTCGTGGTGPNFNVSTTALFLVAAGGVKVAKHGNRGVTKKSGSADVLEALGVNLDLGPARLAEAVDAVGLAFIYARSHHPAMKFVAPVRADLKARTVFNNLGPLTNPAGATRQLMGVYAPELTEKLAHVLGGLGLERALVVHGDGLDDFTVTGPTEVSELRADGAVETYVVTPEDVGLGRYGADELGGADAATNAAEVRGLLAGEMHGAKRDVVLFNAGAALYLADRADDLAGGVELATRLLDEGAGLAKLDAYIAFSQR